MNGYGYGWSFATELMHGYHHHKWISCTPWLHLLQHALLLRPWQPASQILALNRQWSWTSGKKLPKHRHSRIAQKWNLNRSQWKRHIWIETPPCGVDFAGSLQPQRFQSTGNAVLTLLWSCQSLRNISTRSHLGINFGLFQPGLTSTARELTVRWHCVASRTWSILHILQVAVFRWASLEWDENTMQDATPESLKAVCKLDIEI